ncbi:MAG: dihydropteroate synthase [Bacteroidota bacterium]
MQSTLNCRGRLLDLSTPIVMGILNVTPDSFFDGGQYNTSEAVLRQAEKMLEDGAQILDIGGASSRPGAKTVAAEEEIKRVVPAIEAVLSRFPSTIISIDTWRSEVLHAALDAGASIINDISAGRFDTNFFPSIGALASKGESIPYILMHMQGDPGTMQQNPVYEDVVQEVLDFFIAKIQELRAIGVKDIVLDPGFGFGKSVAHNFALLKQLSVFQTITGLPVLAGLSRKSMICRVLGVKPEQALNGTTALHIPALMQGAKILRVHDVREAVEVIRLWGYLENAFNSNFV